QVMPSGSIKICLAEISVPEATRMGLKRGHDSRGKWIAGGNGNDFVECLVEAQEGEDVTVGGRLLHRVGASGELVALGSTGEPGRSTGEQHLQRVPGIEHAGEVRRIDFRHDDAEPRPDNDK